MSIFGLVASAASPGNIVLWFLDPHNRVAAGRIVLVLICLVPVLLVVGTVAAVKNERMWRERHRQRELARARRGEVVSTVRLPSPPLLFGRRAYRQAGVLRALTEREVHDWSPDHAVIRDLPGEDRKGRT